MEKRSFTYYYLQCKEEGKHPVIISHTYDKKTKEHFYKFVDRKKAQKLLDEEKKVNPELKFRIVKLVENYESGEWV